MNQLPFQHGISVRGYGRSLPNQRGHGASVQLLVLHSLHLVERRSYARLAR